MDPQIGLSGHPRNTILGNIVLTRVKILGLSFFAPTESQLEEKLPIGVSETLEKKIISAEQAVCTVSER